MLKKSFLIVGWVLLILMTSFSMTVSAANLELTVSTNSLETCPDRTLTSDDIQINVKNLLPRSDTISLSIEWVANSYSAFIRPEITLASGESKLIDAFWINVPYTLKPGTYTAKITARSGMTGETISKQISIIVLECHLIKIETPSAYKEVCMETELPTTFTFTITNKGKFSETYDLSAKEGGSAVSWASFSEKSITVPSLSSKTVTLTLNPPAAAGTKTVNVIASSKQSYAYSEVPVSLNIKKCLDFSVTATPQKTENVCLGRSVDSELKITNTGSKEDAYKISLPSWSSILSEVRLSPGSSTTLKFNSTPPKAGSNIVEIKVTSTASPSLVKTASVEIVGKECRDAIVIVSPLQNSACAGDDGRFSVTVKNNGTASDKFSLSTNIGQLAKSEVTLDPDQMEVVNLNINTSGLTGTKTITVTAENTAVKKTASAVFVIEKCYDAELSISPSSVTMCPFTDTSFSLVVTNKGTKSDTFTVGYIIDGKTYPEFTNINIEPGATRTLNVNIPQTSNFSEGSKKIDAYATSKHTSLTANATLNIKPISTCYSLSATPASTDKTLKVAMADLQTIVVKNTGEVRQNVSITVTGPTWVYFKPTMLDLAAGEEGTVYVYMSPTYYTLAGNYKVILTAVSAHASAKAEIKVSVLSNITDGKIPTITEVELPNVTLGVSNVSENITANMTTTIPSENITANATAENVSAENVSNLTMPVEITVGAENVTENVTLNATFAGLEGLIIEESRPETWKVIVLAIIVLAIIIILIIRFVLLVK